LLSPSLVLSGLLRFLHGFTHCPETESFQFYCVMWHDWNMNDMLQLQFRSGAELAPVVMETLKIWANCSSVGELIN
jgi:hypothetical protein